MLSLVMLEVEFSSHPPVMPSPSKPVLDITDNSNVNLLIPPAIRKRFGNLEQLMCQKFGWREARKFQVDGTLLQLAGRDAIIHVGTGKGKTAVAAAPYVLEQNDQKSTIFVSPLLSLQDDMEGTFSVKYGVSAIAVNSLLGTKLTQTIKEIRGGKYRIILISPESLLSHCIRDELLTDNDFKKQVFSIVIDEAHVIAYWGSDFRKKYGLLHVVRNYLPGVPVICLSATLTPRIIQHISLNLDMKMGNLALINEGNERPELALAIRKCKHPMNSFRDLGFLFAGPALYHPLDIPKTFVFINSKKEGHRAIRILNSFLPSNLSSLGLIRPFNARHSPQYRVDAMQRFKSGDIRILVCTDAAGMWSRFQLCSSIGGGLHEEKADKV
ncbi:ATP-dependent DNA helicase sgs1 [Ceratobasidium sp. 370]|nr:ATP-dependent DNA helicase sgs1 [Ceratobasidium sp. 370]